MINNTYTRRGESRPKREARTAAAVERSSAQEARSGAAAERSATQEARTAAAAERSSAQGARVGATAEQSSARLITTAAAIILPITLLIFSAPLRASVAQSLRLCAVTVIPSLFPFIAANEFFIWSGAAETLGHPLGGVSGTLFKLGGACASAILTGLVCGYPAGAACAFGLYDRRACTADEAERCAAISNNAGPAFVIGGIGGALLGDARLGAVIWCSTVAVSLAAGVLLRFTAKPDLGILRARPDNTERQNISLAGIIERSALIMLKICAFIVAFKIAADAAGALAVPLGLGGGAGAFFRGVFELTAAADYAARTLPSGAAAVVIAACVGWSGLCVHMQTASLLPRGLSMKRYYLVKLISAPAAAALCAALIRAFGL